jgi:hypothetical protein
VEERGKEYRVIELRVSLLFAGKQYTLVQVWEASQSAAAMENLMAVAAKR